MNKDSKIKPILIFLMIIVLIIFFSQRLSNNVASKEKEYNDFVSLIREQAKGQLGDGNASTPVNPAQQVKKIAMRRAETGGLILEALNDKEHVLYKTFVNDYESYIEDVKKLAKETSIPIAHEPRDSGYQWMSLASTAIMLIFILGIMFFIFRNVQGAGGRALSFGKSKAKMIPENAIRVTFKDVAGIDEVREECQEIISFLKDHKKFHDIGARIPKGVLLMGPPGTGKTLLARAIAGESGVPFFHMSGSDFVEMFVGVGASRVRDLFETAKKRAPCIVFIDEIDAVGRHRGAGFGGGHDEREQTLNQLLVEMDGFEPNDAVIVIAATNRSDVLDPALLRPGRFDRRLTVGLPDVKGRKEILKVYLQRVRSSEDINVDSIALGTPGFSGAELENLVNEAALLTARQDKKNITMTEIELAKDKILMGPERRLSMKRENLMRTVYHEMGHALVSYYMAKGMRHKVHKITVIPRGNAQGVTQYQPKEDVYDYTREELLVRIAEAMGGRAAEDVKYSEFSTGAANDIEQATNIAKAMVTKYGMSVIGPVDLTNGNEDPYARSGKNFEFSEKLASEVDEQILSIINRQYEKAKQVILDNIEVFEHASAILLETQTLDAAEFEMAIHGATLEEIQKVQKEKEEKGFRASKIKTFEDYKDSVSSADGENPSSDDAPGAEEKNPSEKADETPADSASDKGEAQPKTGSEEKAKADTSEARDTSAAPSSSDPESENAKKD